MHFNRIGFSRKGAVALGGAGVKEPLSKFFDKLRTVCNLLIQNGFVESNLK